MKFSIKYQLSPRTEGDRLTENVPIRLRVSFAGIRVDLRSGYVIDAEKWDNNNACVKIGAKNSFNQTAGEINRALTNLSSIVEEVLTRFELDNRRTPTAKEFKAAFDEAAGRKKKEVTPDFFTVFDKFVVEAGTANNWVPATYTKFSSLRKHLYAYMPQQILNQLTKEKLQGFVKYLQDAGQMNTTVSKYMSYVRWFLRWACNNGYYNGLLHEQYKPRFKGIDCKEVIFLSWEELQHFLNYQFPENRSSLSCVRDVFCFCCFTGLRYSDVARLRPCDVKRTTNKPFISIVTMKTEDRLHIELNKYVLQILDKYKNIHFPKGLALPVISNAKMNEYLKEAAEIAGIKEPVRIVFFKGNKRYENVLPKCELLTTHSGRKTFICNAIRLGIPTNVIMEWTGHSDYKAMKPYIKIVDAVKEENMSKFDTFSEERRSNSKK
jgi:integrase